MVRFRHTLHGDNSWVLVTDSTPADVENDPTCFDKYGDGMFIDLSGAEALVSGIGRIFTVMCGDLKKEYEWAQFMVLGGYVKTNENSSSTKHVICRRIGKWVSVDIRKEIANRRAAEDAKVLKKEPVAA